MKQPLRSSCWRRAAATNWWSCFTPDFRRKRSIPRIPALTEPTVARTKRKGTSCPRRWSSTKLRIQSRGCVDLEQVNGLMMYFFVFFFEPGRVLKLSLRTWPARLSCLNSGDSITVPRTTAPSPSSAAVSAKPSSSMVSSSARNQRRYFVGFSVWLQINVRRPIAEKLHWLLFFFFFSAQNQFILENLIDVDRSYNFPVEIEVQIFFFLSKRTKKKHSIFSFCCRSFLSLIPASFYTGSSWEEKEIYHDSKWSQRGQRRSLQFTSDDSPYCYYKYWCALNLVCVVSTEAPVYLSSQSYMADSSLSEEMSQFDFSTGVQSFSFSSQNPEGRRRVPAKRVSRVISCLTAFD